MAWDAEHKPRAFTAQLRAGLAVKLPGLNFLDRQPADGRGSNTSRFDARETIGGPTRLAEWGMHHTSR
jgi:hypothetical protein